MRYFIDYTNGVGGGSSVNPDDIELTYTNAAKTPTTVGGIASNSSFDNVPLQDMWTKLLYPYQAPSFSSFTIASTGLGPFEVGQEFVGGTKTFTWATTNSSNVKTNSIAITNVSGASGLANTGTHTGEITSVIKTSPATVTFTISGQSTQNANFSRNLNISWQYRRFWGVTSDEELTDNHILNNLYEKDPITEIENHKFSSELSTSKTKTATYNCAGGRYFCLAYPSSFGDLNNTIINGQKWNDWVLVKRNVINQFGVSIPMNIYRGFNKINGSLTINWG